MENNIMHFVNDVPTVALGTRQCIVPCIPYTLKKRFLPVELLIKMYIKRKLPS